MAEIRISVFKSEAAVLARIRWFALTRLVERPSRSSISGQGKDRERDGQAHRCGICSDSATVLISHGEKGAGAERRSS